jgi:hypothetical protein
MDPGGVPGSGSTFQVSESDDPTQNIEPGTGTRCPAQRPNGLTAPYLAENRYTVDVLYVLSGCRIVGGKFGRLTESG